MITFLLSIGLLVLGYFTYGKFMEKFFGIDSARKTPALSVNDGVDYMPLPLWRIFMIQFLNIAGLGPIFGAILGAMYGPMAYLWIVIGCIIMGASHDYFSGMLSIRNNGASLPELVGKYLGNGVKKFLRVFTILLLLFVGVAFVSGPAKLLQSLTGSLALWSNLGISSLEFWLYLIFTYYLLATLVPINKIIGKIYPVFGAALLIMAVSIAVVMIGKSIDGSLIVKELQFSDFKNYHIHKETNLLFPMLFIVISCGAISGFHATQSPMMARCLRNEKQGRFAFYGAMIAEGIVAMIWATAAMNFFGGVEGLNHVLTTPLEGTTLIPDPAWIVNEICNTWLGKFGAIIAILGVVVCPITTGDTAFRSARLTIADSFSYKQDAIKNRLIISIPLFILAFVLTFFLKNEFAVVWKFVGISNQILATIVLWTAAVYVSKKNKPHYFLSIPAVFLSFICASYILSAPFKNGGLAIPANYSYIVAGGIAIGLWILFYRFVRKGSKPHD